MKADITRDTFRPEHHYRRVIHQQGRVPLDADLNEAFAIQEHIDRITALDEIGPTGVPKGDSFAITLAPNAKDLLIAPGRIYVDGLVYELDADVVGVVGFPAATTIAVSATGTPHGPFIVGEWIDVFTSTASTTFQIAAIDPAKQTLQVTSGAPGSVAGTGHQVRRRASYARQPDDPAPIGLTTAEGIPALALDSGTYLAYLDVWQRHVTALEDVVLREVALGGPDTTTRARAVWQLRLRRVGDVNATIDCASALPSIATPRGALAARAKLVAQQSDPCIIDPIAKYRRLSNQLYRVEIHAGGTVGDGTCSFKFSRDNGSVVVAWVPPTTGAPSPTTVVVAAPGRDAGLGFAADQWIELIDDTTELSGKAGTLVQIASVDGTALSLKAGTATGSTTLADFPRNPRVRRWDHTGGATRAVERPGTDDGWLMLEDGVQVRFEPGTYQIGDYWLIPARTISGDVEWPRNATTAAPVAKAPAGIEHHFAPLALLDSNAGVVTLRDHDCRVQFPPLTHICAEDVCVKNTPCGKTWDNVQEALEDLCQERDLEWHNQHLHGWGVVDGLQVTCMRVDVAAKLELPRPRECVELANGYAIDPTGADIRIAHKTDADGVVDLGQLVTDAKIVQRDGQGKLPDTSVSLWISPDKQLHVEAYDPNHKTTATDLLDGTIWMDFYTCCLEPVVTWVKAQIEGGPNDDKTALVTPAQQRVIAIIDLLAQLLNPTSGRYVHISDKEDALLRTLYTGLRSLLQSETFCGMFADITLPAYDIFKAGLDATAAHPTSIFGKGSHRRIRITPDGKFAVTCGNGVEIHVYDLAAQKLVNVTSFPASNANVVDVAFRTVVLSRQIIAVANLGAVSDKDSEIVLGTLADDGSITWSNSRVTCSLSFVSLAAFPADPTRVYGAARGDGVYVIQPDSLPKVPERVGAAFFAAGHLVACTRGTGQTAQNLLVASGHATTAFPSTYTFLRQLDIAAPATPFDYQTGVEGHDDVIAVSDPANKVDGPYAIAGTGGARKLLRWAWGTAAPVQSVELLEDTQIALAYSAKTGHVLVTFEDSCQARAYRPVEAALKTDRHPLQLGAVSAAANSDGSSFFVLHWLSNTIEIIPAAYPGPNGSQFLEPWQSAIDVNKLAAYRAAFINAFLKTMGRFAQYLKDCFCERFLINPPDPTGKKVYLADISFKDGAVWQICNFSHRRYVHSFPTVEYWMSLVPVLPMIKLAAEKLCCSVISGMFDKLAVTDQVKADKVSWTIVRNATDTVKAYAIKDKISTAKGQALLTGTVAAKSLADTLRRPVSYTLPAAAGVGATGLVGQSKSAVIDTLGARNIKIGQIHEVAGQSAASLGRIAIAPPMVPGGSTVDLYVDPTGKVVSYGMAPAAAADSQAKITELSATVDTLKTQLTQLQATHDKALADMKASLDEVRKSMVRAPS